MGEWGSGRIILFPPFSHSPTLPLFFKGYVTNKIDD